MNCERVRSLIDAYSTDELDLASALSVEEHLQSCAECIRELESLRSLREAIADPSLRYAAPAELRQNLRLALEPHAEESPSPSLQIRSRPRFRRVALAAAVVVLWLVPWALLYRSASHSTADQLASAITSSHIHSLMSDHLLDVPSTDQHTVKPWFDGKLDFAPTVIDLKNQGFPLIGGRLDYLNNRPVAAIVYQRQKHLINVFTWPASGADSEPTPSHHNGYNLLTWTHKGLICIAVSDLNAQELQQFADLLLTNPTVSRP